MEEENVSLTGTCVSFPVDLTREEFVNYNMLMARTAGPMRGRRWQTITTGVLCLMLLAVALYEYFSTGVMDWLLLGLTLALAAVSVGMWLYIPERMKKQAARQYDDTLESGYNFYGIVEVRPTEIAKAGKDIIAAIPLNANTMFIENKDMMVWMSRQGRSIVLPARCLTPETAGAVRAAADRLPAQNRRFTERLVPAYQPVEEPQPVEITVLWERLVCYTPEEYAAMAKTRVVANYWRRLPQLAAVCLMIALVFGWSENSVLPGIVSFLLALGVFTVFHLVLPYARIPRSPQVLPGRPPSVLVIFTNRGIRLREGNNLATAPWRALEHAYDRGDYAELLFRKLSVRIPKREIEDIDAFNAILKEIRENKQ